MEGAIILTELIEAYIAEVRKGGRHEYAGANAMVSDQILTIASADDPVGNAITIACG
jgi:hypothetical protein